MTIYKKEVSGVTTPSLIKMNFYAKLQYNNLDKELILNVDNESYKLNFINITSKFGTKPSGSFGPFGFYNSWYYLSGEIQLTPEIELNLKKSQNVIFIISSEGVQTKLQLLDDQLLKLKEYLNTK